MKRLAALLALVCLAPAPVVAGVPQSLAIELRDDAANARQLAHYTPKRPIVVSVGGDAKRYDGVTVVATGPDGRAITQSLARGTDDFTGALSLGLPGTWQLALTTSIGAATTRIATIPVDVVYDPLADLAPYLALVLSVAFIAVGVSLVASRRVRATQPL